MVRKLVPTLLVIAGLFSAGAVRAAPLTFYTNEAAWLAAVSGFKVGTYSYGVSYSESLINVALIPPFPYTCCIVSTPPPIFPFYPPVLGANFTSLDITFSSVALNLCIYPCTFATDVGVNFPTPIYGFGSLAMGEQQDGFGSILLNRQPLPFDFFIGGFFRVVGLINSLDFSCVAISCNPTYDENNFLSLQNIVVATIDEPSAFVSLATSIFLLVFVLGLSRRFIC
jgi:hypothetical protein